MPDIASMSDVVFVECVRRRHAHFVDRNCGIWVSFEAEGQGASCEGADYATQLNFGRVGSTEWDAFYDRLKQCSLWKKGRGGGLPGLLNFGRRKRDEAFAKA
mmetsp:Transcript_18971/g.64115  ORF Transcript_18971/g.64115 Transcript_18971/m.64115 type:complete len:102 (-) Transcript_18971:735-1040(-)